jgi:hypothetical protein
MAGEGARLKESLQRRADIAECCKRPGTLVASKDQLPNTALLICTICGRKHRYMRAETGILGWQPQK